MTELKPCPCGGTAFLYEQSYDYGETHQVECIRCCLNTPCSQTKEEASAVWNNHPMHKKDEEIVRLQTGFIRIIHEVKAGATDTEVNAICREMLGFKGEE